jgi:predicted TIM-barrel fold metal-dependent hydrolase
VASVPWLDEDSTMSILLEALDGGAGAVGVQAIPGEVSPTHPQYAGLWATLEERGVPFVLHINGFVRPMNSAFFYNGHDCDAPLGNNVRGKEYMVSHHPPEAFLSALVLDGLFEKHPRLMGGCIELSGVWVASWLRRLDHCQEMWGRGDETLPRLPMKPSEYVQRNLFFTPFAGEPVAWMIEQCGESMFMFSSDYPHWEGTPDPIGTFEASMNGISDSARESFYWRNYAELLGLAIGDE